MRFAFVLLLALAACAHRPPSEVHATPRLSLDEVTRHVPEKVLDREGWALDVLTALDAHRLWPDAEAVCSVLAVIEQESGFKANPPVPGLAKIVRAKLDDYAEKAPVVGRAAIDALLDAKAKGSKLTFAQRLDRAQTERDLDVIFRDMLKHYETEFPATYRLVDLGAFLSGRGGLEGLNPITTAGSMQVSVRFAMENSKDEKLEEWQVRDRLYTRAGGVYYGTLRLLGFDADYDDPIFRFADYNAGFYSSRNAALQEELGALTGEKLVLDGDLLAYDKAGEATRRETESLAALRAFAEKHPEVGDVRDDALKEKTRALESTQTWRSIKSAWGKRFGKAPPYARLPDVAVRSPKMKKERSTKWFAESVNRRYLKCLERGR